MFNTITIKRPKISTGNQMVNFYDHLEDWVAYWRANPHRFITEYLGLKLYYFQKVIIYMMYMFPNFIFAASRGLAKSTITLLFALYRCILYPGQKIVVVAPTRSQSASFIKKVKDFLRESPNLAKEIDVKKIKANDEEGEISFWNGSKIYTKTCSENARGERCHIIIVDEYAQITKPQIITKVFVPMMTNTREPLYTELTDDQKLEEKAKEPNHQLYLSSIRSEQEWSWVKFCDYIDFMLQGQTSYLAFSLPYHLGVEAGYITPSNVEQQIMENQGNLDILKAEYEAIPLRDNNGAFFKFSAFNNIRLNTNTFVALPDENYIYYQDKRHTNPYKNEKLPGEIRVLSMDVALIESPKNDNTSFWLTRLIPSDNKYQKIVSYAESMHGLNSMTQALRAKQIFYEFDCDWFVIDGQGNGRGVADVCMTETYDDVRGKTYPAWTSANQEDIKTLHRSLSADAVPVMFVVTTSSQDKHNMFINMRDWITNGDIILPANSQDALEALDKKYNYYKMESSELRANLMNPFAQTDMLVIEATNLETVPSGGYINLKEKPSRRKDRVMSLAYNLYYCKQLEENYIATHTVSNYDILDYIQFI